jgi:nitric oxide reductase large subunit
MNALAHSYLFWIALIFALFGLYILPSVIAAIRGVQGLGWIIVINLIPTGVGWLAALVAALMLPRREPSPNPRRYGTQPQPPAAHWPTYRAWPDSWSHE